MNKKKADGGITEETAKNALEADLSKQRKEVQEGLEAEVKIKELQKGDEQKRQEIGGKYLDGMPYELERVIGETKAFLQQTVTGIIEAGKRLTAMKEFEKYGEWEKIVEGRIGISRITAWRFMAIARKLSVVSRVKQLAITGIGDGIGKLYALLNVTDDELTEFDETGMFRGATVDDLNKMSAKDIRKLIVEKEDLRSKINQLELQLNAKYDMADRNKKLEEKNKHLEKEKQVLERKYEQTKHGLSEDDIRSLGAIQSHKDQFDAIITLMESADVMGYSSKVRADFVTFAEYIHDRVCLMFDLIRNTHMIPGKDPVPDAQLDEDKKWFTEKYGKGALG